MFTCWLDSCWSSPWFSFVLTDQLLLIVFCIADCLFPIMFLLSFCLSVYIVLFACLARLCHLLRLQIHYGNFWMRQARLPLRQRLPMQLWMLVLQDFGELQRREWLQVRPQLQLRRLRMPQVSHRFGCLSEATPLRRHGVDASGGKGSPAGFLTSLQIIMKNPPKNSMTIRVGLHKDMIEAVMF